MDAANKNIINEETRRRLAEIVRVYVSQPGRQAHYWAGLLTALPGFSYFYYRTHLLLGEHSLYRVQARENGDLAVPYPLDWYLIDGRNSGRLEDALDQRVYLDDGRLTEPVLGIDVHFKRILCEDGVVYQLRNRIDAPKKSSQAALLAKS